MSDIFRNRTDKFDLQLSAGIARENALARIFGNRGLKVEVKSESYHWARSGNLAIEYANRGHRSGLAVTEADLWVHELLTDDRKQVIARVVFEVPTLKRLCAVPYLANRRIEHGGDDKQSSFVLLSMADLMNAAQRGRS